ncbi:MAG TPA: VacJ family lipoprotein [Caulobacteraceae bacterium]|jgi:phospholipid-binding lipoprotein MlaA|nr:VacJ family lipoprotein [Caulobacteraceae bacterium]
MTLIGFGVALAAADARAQTPGDPYEGINRRFYANAMHLNQKYFTPLVRLYHALTPGLIGVAIHNMITNLSEPVAIVNDVLQGRLKVAGRDTLRVAANTSLGIGGMVDIAGKEGFPHHDNDFGITLGVWGVKPGPYLFVPLLGPSTVRDSIGAGVDVLLNPFTYVRFPGRLTLQYTTAVVGVLDKRQTSQGELDTLTADAADPYATLRSVYLQSREAEIRGDNAAPELTPLDDPGATAPPPPGPGATAAPSAAPATTLATESPPASVQVAAVADVDAPMATAFPCDTNHFAPQRLAAAN